MTDKLRDRIAAAIYNASDEYTRKLMVRPDCPGASELEGDSKPVCYGLADAIIAELDWEWGIQYHAVPSGVVLGSRRLRLYHRQAGAAVGGLRAQQLRHRYQRRRPAAVAAGRHVYE